MKKSLIGTFAILASACAIQEDVEFEVNVYDNFMSSIDSEGVDAVEIVICGNTEYSAEVTANVTFVNGHGEISGTNESGCKTELIVFDQEVEVYSVNYTYTVEGQIVTGDWQKVMKLIN